MVDELAGGVDSTGGGVGTVLEAGGVSMGAFAGGGVTCSAGAVVVGSGSSEHAASKPKDSAAAARANGVRRDFMEFSYSDRS